MIMKQWIIAIILIVIFLPPSVFARISVNDQYQAKRQAYQEQLSKLTPANQQKVKEAEQIFIRTNNKILARYDSKITALAATLEEIKRKQGESSLDQAEYWLNFAAEAVAYQKIADYTPNISGDASVEGAIKSQANILKSDIRGLLSKILKAKSYIDKYVTILE